jgi:hypothetical protein
LLVRSSARVFQFVDLDPCHAHRVTKSRAATIGLCGEGFNFDVAADGRAIVFSRGRNAWELMLVDLPVP